MNVPPCAFRRQRHLDHAQSGGTHARDVRGERGARVLVDDRTDIDGEPPRVTDGELVHRAFEHRRLSGATSSCTHKTRSAEHRWPALSNADTSASATTCSESAELSAIIAFWPPVSAISTGSSARGASARAMPRATSVEPVKITRGHARIGDQRRADGLAASREELQRRGGHAGAMQDCTAS